jgi:hypothetical protein
MPDSIQLFNPTSPSRTSIGRRTRPRRGILHPLAAAQTLLVLLLVAATAFAGSATWNLNSGDGNELTLTVVP